MFAEKTSRHTQVVQPKLNSETASLQRKEEGAFFGDRQKPGFFSSSFVQPKLSISQPGDAHEREADTMAGKVMTMPEPMVATVKEKKEKDIMPKEEEMMPLSPVMELHRSIQCKADKEEKKVMPKSFTGIQRKASVSTISTASSSSGSTHIQTKSSSRHFNIQRQVQERGPPQLSSSFERTLQNSRSGGTPIPTPTRRFMESRFGADFSGINIHTGSTAVQMNREINAQAFTHGNNIYFNAGKYQPDSYQGRSLLAHELTHTIQQGAARPLQSPAAAPSSGGSRAVSRSVQRSAIPAVSPSAGRAPPVQPQAQSLASKTTSAPSMVQTSLWDTITGGIEAGRQWFLGQVRDFVQSMPGYLALRVALGSDPITGEHVDRNGHNFIEAAFDIIPGGRMLHQKLSSLGALREAEQWVDNQIARVTRIVSNVTTRISSFVRNLTVSSLASPGRVIDEAIGIVRGVVRDIIDFAVSVASEMLETVKRYLINQLVSFIREHTTAYPLLRVILGRDPVTDEVVPKNGANILTAVLELGGETGREQLRQMTDTGTFQRVAAWIDEGIGIFANAYDRIRQGFRNIWSRIGIESLMDPLGTFRMIYNEFSEPVGNVLRFVVRTAAIILQFIKEALMRRLSAYARTVRGYPLIQVLLGSDPFTQERVPRTIVNIVHGFMSLMDGGEEQFQQLMQSGAIQRTVARVNAAVARLNMTPSYIVGLFTGLWNSFSINDLAHPIQAFQRIVATFGEPIGRLVDFVIEIVKIVVGILLQMMNFPTDLIINIFNRTVQSFTLIKRDPIGFLKNLLRAIKQGFIQFFQNILQHLLAGLQNWLLRELSDSGVQAPTDFSFRGILGWILGVLGISMEKIWEKLAQHPRIGAERVARIRGMIDRLDGIWTFIRDVQQRGMVAIWERIQQQLTNLWDTVLDAIKSWIMTRIVAEVTTRLLSLLDPTGIMAVINSAIAIYRAIQSFVQYLRQMLEIVNSFVEGVAQIASGNVSVAANFLERTLARGIPIVIGFLANQVGLGGLGRRIGEMIERIRAMVDRALTWLVDRAVTLGGSLLDMLRAGASSVASTVRGWVGRLLGLEKRFDGADGTNHRLFFAAREGNAVLMMNPIQIVDFATWINTIQFDTTIASKVANKARAIQIAADIDTEKARAVTGSSPAAIQANEAAKERTIRGLIEDLSVQTGPLFAGQKPRCANAASGLVFNRHGKLFGSEMTATYLTNIQQPPGSSPTQTDPDYDILNQRTKGMGPYYVRGHLLNDNIGGKGDTWDNLTPLTGDANGDHERLVESRVKTAVDSGNIVFYKVHAVYGRTLPTPLPTSKRKLEIAQKEVQHVPTRLICEAFMVTQTGPTSNRTELNRTPIVPAGTVVENTIDHNYILQRIRRSPIYLDCDDAARINQIDTMNLTLANKIVKAWRERTTPFGSFESLSNYVFDDGSTFTALQKGVITDLPNSDTDTVYLFNR